MKTFFVLLLAVMTLSLSGGLYAHEEHPPKGPKGPYPHVQSLGKFKETLKLSDVQVQELDKLNKLFKEKHKANKSRLDPLEDRLRDLEKNDPIDFVAAERVLREAAEVHTAMRLDKMKHHQELMRLLNKEQKAEFKKFMEAEKEKMKSRSKGRMDDDDRDADRER
jgi:Spy/CpxP family protein refolding chaperone